jgi:DNA-binding CsgD family transcriptional regulator
VSDHPEPLLRLIAATYDAALDSALWPSVLEKAVGFVGGTASALFLKDVTRHSQDDVFTWGYDDAFIKSYKETYIHLDPFSIGQFLFGVDEVISLDDLMPHAEFRQTRFFKEWVQPQNWIDAIGATLEKSNSAYSAVSVIRHVRDGIADPESRERMRMIVPHLRRSVTISRIMDAKERHGAALAETLDGLSAAVFLLDPVGRIMHANAHALTMIAEAAIVRSAAGKLMVVNLSADRALHDILLSAAKGDPAIGGKGIALPFTVQDSERYIADVLPLTTGARRSAGSLYSAVAAVFLRKASLDLPHPLEALARTFKLTRAEVAVLMGIVNVGRASDVAEVLGISEATVRVHLKKIFDKTGVGRQVDLVKLVANFAGPLAH